MSFTAPLQMGIGILQSIGGRKQERRATAELERMVNSYKPNSSILDLYNKSLSRYSANPYTSQSFTSQSDRIKGGTAQGIQALGDRRSILAGLPRLIQQQNDSLGRAAANAEGQQAQALGQLGQATGMKAQEDFKPFEMKYNLKALKAAGGSQIMNAGINNIFGGMKSLDDSMKSLLSFAGGGGGM